MAERVRNWILTNAFPIAIGLLALGAAKLQLEQKEDASAHALDVQRLEAQERSDVKTLMARDEANYALQLDVLCAVKPKDRRCYPTP